MARPLLLVLLLVQGCAAPAAQPIGRPAGPPAPTHANAPDFQQRALEVHNSYRAAAGVPPLQWDSVLAAGAQGYAAQLTVLDSLTHSPRASRPGQGENLWRGSPGAYPVEAMVQNWGEERSMFRPAVFPNVSTTGNWLDVSHYTQMIWRSTTHVGCAVRRSRSWEYLVCRYAPKGNRDGQPVP